MVYLMIGILVTQLLYVISNWGQYRKNDYVRYGLYIGLFLLYFICIFVSEVFPEPSVYKKVRPFADIAKRPIAFLIYLVYFRFMDLFLELKEKYPLLHRQVLQCYRWIAAVLVVQVILLATGTAFSPWGNIAYFGFSILLFGLSVLFIIRAYREKTRLTVTLLRGSICLSTGAFITNLFNIVSPLVGRSIQVVPDYLFLFIGILLELFFFNMALAYKITQEETELAETQQKVIEQLQQNEQLALEQQQTRNKIARDLHDEVGATLSGVTLFSELSLRRLQGEEPSAVKHYLQRISNECSQMSEKINDIVWTTQLHNDSLEKLFQRLHDYAKPICVSKGVELRFQQDAESVRVQFADDIRNHLYLFCKEAINNSLKYAQAATINFDTEYTDRGFCVRIADNGNGFDTTKVAEGNGLKNMRVRARDMGGDFMLQSQPGAGTSIHLIINTPD